MRTAIEIRKIVGGIVLALLIDCIFLFIKPTLAIDWGFGIPLTNLRFTLLFVGIIIVVLYHIYYRSSANTTKLSLTTMFTVIWLSLIVFFPFNPPATASDAVKSSWYGSGMAFFVLLTGLALCVLWVHFFSDEL